jgi:hypothetical protein
MEEDSLGPTVRAGEVAQVIKRPPSKLEVLSSKPILPRQKKKETTMP